MRDHHCVQNATGSIVTEARMPSAQRLGARALGRGLLLVCGLYGLASAQDLPAPALPTFAELEAAGATIGEIRVVPLDIFDTADPKEDKLLFRAANALHIQTRPSVIRRALLFKSGEPVSLRLLEETERLLRSSRYLYDVQLRPVAYHDGVVDIEVSTRDTWSLDPGISAGRSGGANSSGIHFKEYNLLGSGMTLNFAHSRNVDRTSNEFQFSGERLYGTWASIGLSHAVNSDGRRNAASIVRPFYALDSRWSAGITASEDSRIEAIYSAGKVTSEYRHDENKAEAFAGWSPGLADGWVQRYSLGLAYQKDRYAPEPGLLAPARLPNPEKLVTPFIRVSVIEDRYARELNRNLIGRPEFFALGLASTVQLGWASNGLGSSREALVYALTISRGFEPMPNHTLTASASLEGQYTGAQVRRQRLGAQAQYYLPQTQRWLFYASAAGDMLTRPDAVDSLLLGGDNGLRGYPLRYQSGTRRALFTVEERFYTDLYIWRLFRIGGAAFFDVGRAWGGDNLNTARPGWLGNAGFGLRIVSARAAFSNVLHVDVAFPSHTNADVKKVQFLVKTKTSF
jgi:hypothetical protein